LSDPSYRHVVHQFEGAGYRPYRVAHLKATDGGDEVTFRWVRRTRVDGDIWGAGDVPLGEEAEAYRVQVVVNGSIQREVTVNSPAWTYTDAMRAADTGGAAYGVRVAQISSRYGPGPDRALDIG
jgi:hypothetical protein